MWYCEKDNVTKTRKYKFWGTHDQENVTPDWRIFSGLYKIKLFSIQINLLKTAMRSLRLYITVF